MGKDFLGRNTVAGILGIDAKNDADKYKEYRDLFQQIKSAHKSAVTTVRLSQQAEIGNGDRKIMMMPKSFHAKVNVGTEEKPSYVNFETAKVELPSKERKQFRYYIGIAPADVSKVAELMEVKIPETKIYQLNENKLTKNLPPPLAKYPGEDRKDAEFIHMGPYRKYERWMIESINEMKVDYKFAHPKATKAEVNEVVTNHLHKHIDPNDMELIYKGTKVKLTEHNDLKKAFSGLDHMKSDPYKKILRGYRNDCKGTEDCPADYKLIAKVTKIPFERVKDLFEGSKHPNEPILRPTEQEAHALTHVFGITGKRKEEFLSKCVNTKANQAKSA